MKFVEIVWSYQAVGDFALFCRFPKVCFILIPWLYAQHFMKLNLKFENNYTQEYIIQEECDTFF